jgi:hypothetical protein
LGFSLKIPPPDLALTTPLDLIATPAHLAFPPIDPEALEAALLPPATQASSSTAASETARKESLSAASGITGKKNIKEIVASIDPRVRVDPQAEDVSF